MTEADLEKIQNDLADLRRMFYLYAISSIIFTFIMLVRE
jgi:hypothetical protein